MIMNGTVELVCYGLVLLIVGIVIAGVFFGKTIVKNDEEDRNSKYYSGE